jgi:adenine-specific DNA glycosylase
MGGLWEFPYFAKSSLGGLEEIKKELTALLGVAPTYCAPLETVTHQFTRFRVTLLPTLWKVEQKSPVSGYAWKGYEELLKLPFSSGHRRLLHQMVLLV